MGEVAKRHGVSEATIYIWRKKYGSMETSEVKRLKELETENARRRKLLVDRDLEIEVMKEINAKNGRRTDPLAQAWYAISRGVCQRLACALLEVSRSGLYYTLRMPMKDEPVAQAMQRLSGQYPCLPGLRRNSGWPGSLLAPVASGRATSTSQAQAVKGCRQFAAQTMSTVQQEQRLVL